MSNLKYSDENIILIIFYMNIKIMNDMNKFDVT